MENLPPPRPDAALRADAERNRRSIITAATEAFRERGVEISVDEIARRAGVGNATLYRRFPTREDLLAAAVEERLAAYADRIERALDDPDPWTGFCRLLHSICDLQTDDAGMRDILATSQYALPTGENRQRALNALRKVISRAQNQGMLRLDLRVEDITVLFMANAGIIRAGTAAPPGAAHRHIDYMIDACRRVSDDRLFDID